MTPARIEGKPLSILAAKRTPDASFVSGPISARKTPAITPIGTLIRAAMTTIATVPTMAFPNAPVSCPDEFVKEERLSLPKPRTTSM